MLMLYLRDAVRRYRRRRAARRLRWLRSSVAYIERALRWPAGLTEQEQEELRDLLTQQRKALCELIARAEMY